jgi:hypothetical protein
MFYYLYEIKNNLNNKIYIGVHKTDNIDDGYMGSGKLVSSAIEKYGIENFTKTVIETFDNEIDMYQREKEIVNKNFLSRKDVYNLATGGSGGFDYINKNSLDHKGYANRKEKNKKVTPFNRLDNFSEEWKEQLKINRISGLKRANELGLIPKFTKEINKKMSIRALSPDAQKKKKETFKKINHQQGETNSQYGTCWVYHPEFGNKKINKTELDNFVSLGYNKGRKIKQN